MLKEDTDQDMFFRTVHCLCRDLNREDLDIRCDWGDYPEDLLSYYNLNVPVGSARDRMYRRWKVMKRKWYAFDHLESGKMIAVLSLREISRLWKSARLGLVMDPAFINQGLGQEIIRGFLDYYFNIMGFRKMYLDVARFNTRAAHCYAQCGFNRCGEFWREYPGSYAIVKLAEFEAQKQHFNFKRNRLMAVYDDMLLLRKDWPGSSDRG